ncbi:MarR family winged helix-turn-helix transcriptional regulator [Cohnella fermenti]|uniref:MarR family transcriptional regulator n=1 Tax=Cohnella fermenti TaxID=2565925 RepID=A0A4S4C0P2_9BACL|nr:MarR family transcriptional regulator [Cohnella fermenti]
MEIAAEFVRSWLKLSKDWSTEMDAELAPQLTAGQLQVLELLKQFEPMKPSDLLPYLETTPAAVTTLLDRMERNGLVRRDRDEQDRRIVWVRMTDLGRSEAERGLKVRSDIVTRSLERLSLHNRQLLIYLIGKVAGTWEPPAGASSPSDKGTDKGTDKSAEASAPADLSETVSETGASLEEISETTSGDNS